MTSEQKMTKDLLIGAHTSIAGGLHNALYEAQSIGASVTQIFTANQRRWQPKPIEQEQIDLWHNAQQETGIKQVMSHDSYLINLAATDPQILEKSLEAMGQEITRCQQLGIQWLNFHPGSGLGASEQQGLDRIVTSLLTLRPLIEAKGSPLLLLEATAGQGSQLGCSFEQLAYIIECVNPHMPIGVCIDTCHIFVAGYDIRGHEGWTKTIDTFDRIVGISFLKTLHVNDSLKGLGTRVDRHAPLGEGTIGWDCFEAIVSDKRTRSLPMFLETPLGAERWAQEISQLKKYFQNHLCA